MNETETKSEQAQTSQQHRTILQIIAKRVMLEKGLLPQFPPAVLTETAAFQDEPARTDPTVRDLRHLLWCSLDNDDSLDLDQLTVAEELADGTVRILVAIADVDGYVRQGTALDQHAAHNTASVYTMAEIFPMLPPRLSNDLTSLNPGVDRQAIVVDMTFAPDGILLNSDVYRGLVHNQAKLAYISVAAWLDQTGPMPDALQTMPGLADNMKLQERVAKALQARRFLYGALGLETIEVKPVFEGDELKSLTQVFLNRATDIIEEFMIAANSVTARYLTAHQFPSIRRVVRVPKRWERIVELAAEHEFLLPAIPDSKALDQFLQARKKADPLHYPDISLDVIKLLGPGQYSLELPGGSTEGHFGLAVKDYNHSTAPNRRYPDLITQRLLKAAMSGSSNPYTSNDLARIAENCTLQEDAARKVERQVEKSAAALLLESKVGQEFDALVTGASIKGTWVRLLDPPVEGKVLVGYEGLDIGQACRVQLLSTNVGGGYIDFRAVRPGDKMLKPGRQQFGRPQRSVPGSTTQRPQNRRPGQGSKQKHQKAAKRNQKNWKK